MNLRTDLQSPLLDTCPETLPAEAYTSEDWHRREMRTIFSRNWVLAGRRGDFAPGTLTRREIAGVPLIVASGRDGTLRAFHNTCRHRGAALCQEASEPFNGKLIRCPYHAWAYSMEGRLVSTGFGTPTADFDKTGHGLFPVALREWNGFVFLNLADEPEELAPDTGLGALDNWPMEELVPGHVFEKELACNWKIFWENYNECLHCPGIHPELSDLVPVYKEGVMSDPERRGWEPGQEESPALKAGARSWTLNGQPCGPEFAGLTADERAMGHVFVTLYPTAFVVAHVDYVRSVTVTPLAPDRTHLRAEWLFHPDTLAQPGFDLQNVTGFATLVLEQDGAACEWNQRGLASPKYAAGRLMPQEFDIHRFHGWVLDQMK